MASQVATNTMMRLPAAQLMTMRAEFLREGDAGLTLAQFVRVMLRRGRQASRKRWEKAARTQRMAGLVPAQSPAFESDESDADESSELRDEHGLMRPFVDANGRPNLGAVDDLCELFDQIDVNGDARLEWDEFTRCVIEHGMAGNVREAHDCYAVRSVREDKEVVFGVHKPGAQGNGPLKFLRWLPELRLLGACAAGQFGLLPCFPRQRALRLPPKPVYTALLEISDAEDIIVDEETGSIDALAAASSLVNDTLASQVEAEDEVEHRTHLKDAVVSCLDLAFAPGDELLVALCSDLTLRFYHFTARASCNDETVKYRGAVRLPDPCFRLAWWAGALLEPPHAGARLCFLVGPRQQIACCAMQPFDATARPLKSPRMTMLAPLIGHADSVTDALVLDQPREVYTESMKEIPREPGLLATCSMDATIRLWSLPDRKEVWKLEGHIGGVRSLSYDRIQHTLLSCGFEYTIRGWGVTGYQAFPLFTLESGHASSIAQVRCAPGGAAFAVSLDDDGVLCWWDTSRDSVASAEERLTHRVQLEKERCLLVEPVGFGVDVESAEGKFRDFAIHRAERLLQGEDDDVETASSTRITKRRPDDDDAHTKRALADAATASQAIAYSSNAISLVCGGKRGILRLLDASDPRDAEAPASFIDYSSRTHEILTAHDSFLKLWDARTGLLLHEQILEDSLISGISFDARGRRCVVSDRSGTIKIRRARDGLELMYLGTHKAEVSSMAYCPFDRIVVSVGWDKALHVYDELEANPQDSLLRCTTNCHATDVQHVCFSRDEGLICTGDAAGALRLWDFESLVLVGECYDQDGAALPPASAVAFIKPYPCLVVTDGESGIRLIPTRPYVANSSERRSRLRFENGKAARIDGELWRGAAANCATSFVDLAGGRELAPGIRSGRVLVYTGDSRGAVQAFDVRSALQGLDIEAIAAQHVKWRKGGYNARRKLSRDHALSGDVSPRSSGEKEYPIRAGVASYSAVRWDAHDAAVTCIRVVSDPPRLISCSLDGSIKAWTLDGVPVGVLTRGRDADARALRNLAAPGRLSVAEKLKASTGEGWRFLGGKDVRRRQAVNVARAKAILRDVVAAKRRERRQSEVEREMDRARDKAEKRVLDSDSLQSAPTLRNEPSLQERTRLIGQLGGEATWAPSEFDRVRAKALQAREASQAKLKKKGKRRKKKPAVVEDEGIQLDDDEAEKEAERVKAEALRKELKKHEMKPDPKDPSNYGVGSLNREKAMYPAHHIILEERGDKKPDKNLKVKTPGMLAAEAAAVSKLTEPSPFLRAQFGVQARFGETGAQSVAALDELQRAARAPSAAVTEEVVASAPAAPDGESSEYTAASEDVRTWGETTFGNVNKLPPLTEPHEHTRTVAATLQRWRARVDGYAKLVDEPASSSFVARVHEPLLTKTGSLRQKRGPRVTSKPRLNQEGPGRKKRTTAKQFYGPYPFSNIDAFVKAYETALPAGSPFGAPAPLSTIQSHDTVQGNDYLRRRAETVAKEHESTLSLKGFLRGYFPLIKPSELAECMDVCLARRGIDTFGRGGKASADEARRRELRTVFALFDVGGRGSISMADVRNAVAKGGAGLSEADAGDWPALAEALEAKIGGIDDGEIGFEDFARIVEGALRQDDET